MHKIEIHNIRQATANPRSVEVAAAVAAPIADIEVAQTDSGLKVLNGHIRLNVQLDVHGSATVRAAGTGEQFTVRRAPDGTIVRV